MTYEKQRQSLADQLAAAGITDQRVLNAISTVPRHLFVPEALVGQAYRNVSLPLAEGQTISQPLTVARVLQALELKGNEKVLEVGTGSGYQAALLARLAARVFTIERLETLARQARRVLDSLNLYNVNVRVGDGSLGWSRYQPYDAVAVAAAGPEPPKILLEQLAPGGKMVIPLGAGDDQKLVRIVRESTGLRQELIDPCRFVPLIGKEAWPE